MSDFWDILYSRSFWKILFSRGCWFTPTYWYTTFNDWFFFSCACYDTKTNSTFLKKLLLEMRTRFEVHGMAKTLGYPTCTKLDWIQGVSEESKYITTLVGFLKVQSAAQVFRIWAVMKCEKSCSQFHTELNEKTKAFFAGFDHRKQLSTTTNEF